MRVPAKLALLSAAVCLAAASAWADEIRLKDGKKLYGVIVAFEDNMFKVKTDYGFVLVEKDKIASIVPTTPSAATPAAATPAEKPASSARPAKTPETKPAPESKTSSATNSAPAPEANSAAPAPEPADTSTFAVARPKVSADPIRPELPAAIANT